MKESITPLSQKYYRDRVSAHLNEGMTLVAAEEAADMDLLEWSRPLDLPLPPASEWEE